MAEDVGTLVARVVADTEQFRSEMLSMTRQLETNTAKMNTALARVNAGMGAVGAAARTATRLLGAFGIGLSVSALVRYARSSVEAADAIGEMAKAAGLGAERFQRLQFVFTQNGVEAGQFQSAMNALNTSLGQFIATGGGRAKKALEELGLSSRIMNGEIRTSEQLFDVVVEKFQGIDSAAVRAGLAAQLFGREIGAKMVDTLSAGSEALAEMEERVSGVIGEEQIRQADELDKAFRSMAQTVGTTLKSAFVAATHAVFDFFGAFDETERELVEDIKEIERSLDRIREGTNPRALAQEAELVQRLIEKTLLLNRLRAAGREATSGAGAAGAVGDELGGITSRPMRFLGAQGSVTDLAAFRAAAEQRIAAEKEFEAQRLVLAEQVRVDHANLAQAVVDEERRRAAERVAIEQSTQAAIKSAREQTAFAAMGFLQALGAEHRGAAIAAIAIEKAMSIKQIFIESKKAQAMIQGYSIAAQAHAMAALGPVFGPPAAAAIAAKFAAASAAVGINAVASAAFVAAQGLVEAMQLSHGGTSTTRGTSANPTFTTSTGPSLATSTIAANRQTAVQVIIQGNFGWDEYVQRRVIDSIRRAVDGRDVVIIGPNSRQAEMLRGEL